MTVRPLSDFFKLLLTEVGNCCNITCADLEGNQRGNGVGGVHCARNSHKVIPLNAFDGITQYGNGQPHPKSDPGDPPVVIKMVTPVQQTAEQANSDLKRKADEIKDFQPQQSHQSGRKRRKVQKQADKYDDLPLFTNV